MGGKAAGYPDSFPGNFIHRQKEPDQLPGLGMGEGAFQDFGSVTLKMNARIKVE